MQQVSYIETKYYFLTSLNTFIDIAGVLLLK